MCVCVSHPTPPPKSYGHWVILLKDRGLFVDEVIIQFFTTSVKQLH